MRNDEFSLVKEELVHVANGLAPVMCYEPWFPRTLESIKQSIADGYPVLTRLHSASMYPSSLKQRYRNDLESHTVVITGYDDENRQLRLSDPWNKSWGGSYGNVWYIPYEDISILNVDSSLGITTCLSPLKLDAKYEKDKDNNLIINLTSGFYIPVGTVMDIESFTLSELSITCNVKTMDNYIINRKISGKWNVGDNIILSVPMGQITEKEHVVEIIASAKISGVRPYTFSDLIDNKVEINISSVSNCKNNNEISLAI